MYSDKVINQIYYEKLNSINARNRIQRDLKYAVSLYQIFGRVLLNSNGKLKTFFDFDLLFSFFKLAVQI